MPWFVALLLFNLYYTINTGITVGNGGLGQNCTGSGDCDVTANLYCSDNDSNGDQWCQCITGWIPVEQECQEEHLFPSCNAVQMVVGGGMCVDMLGRQCNDTSDCAGITSAECESESDDSTSWCKCMSGWRPQGYTDCVPDDMSHSCGSGQMFAENYGCVEAINYPCYPTRYCGPDPDITCKSMNGDETMAQCQCKEGLTWTSHLYQCSNETASQECDFGHIFISATSTECEPVIGHSCDGSSSSCGYMAGVECDTDINGPFTFKCSCMAGWTQQQDICVLDTTASCNDGQVWDADQGCVYVLGRPCNDTSDCTTIPDVECVSEGDGSISRCMCMPGWRPQGYTTCIPDDTAYSCGSGQMLTDNHGCVEVINNTCFPTRYCGPDQTITCKSINGDETMAQCQCKDGWTWNNRLLQCSNVTANQECDYGHIFISATSTECEPVIGHSCERWSSSNCGYIAGVEWSLIMMTLTIMLQTRINAPV